MIKELSVNFEVKECCEALRVSRSGFYRWQEAEPSRREKENAQLVEQIKKVFAANKSRYGSPRVTRELRQQGLQCGEKRIARLMRQNKLVARAKKASRPRTTVAGSSAAPNLIKGLEPTGVNQIWVSDITYLATLEGWLYFGGHSGCVQEAFFSTLKSECLPATQGL
jgi:putative transposase